MEKKSTTGIPLEKAQLTKEELASASPLELCRLGQFVKRPEEIPIANIAQEESIVDFGHAQELADSMQEVWGQTSRITVGARLKNDRVDYYITDGFHRTEAKRMTGATTIEAEVLYGLSMEVIFDHRVLAASSVTAVKFARLARWMQQSFNHSEWGKTGLSLSQALGLTVFDNSGKILGISPEDAIGLKEWIRRKARVWQGKVGTFYQIIRSVENSFPEIVEKVRSGSGGGHGKGQGILNPTRFMAMVEHLPGNLEQQRLMVDLIIRHDLNKEKVKLVAQAVATQPDPMTLEMLSVDPLSIAEELLLESEEKPPEFVANYPKREGQQPSKFKKMRITKGTDAYDRKLTEGEMLREISQLKQALENAQAALSAGGENESLLWYQHSELSFQERSVMKLVIEEGLSPEQVANRLKITANQAFGFITSATTRAFIRFRDQWLNRQIQQIQKKTKKKSSRQTTLESHNQKTL